MSAKEAMLIVVDIGPNVAKTKFGDTSLFEEHRGMLLKFIEKKIYDASKDEMAFLILGTDETDNPMDIPNFSILQPFDTAKWSTYKMIHAMKPSSKAIDWTESIKLAVTMLENRISQKKVSSPRIVLLSSFNTPVKESNIDEATLSKLEQLAIQFSVISGTLVDLDGKEDEKRFAQEAADKILQRKNQKIVNELLKHTKGAVIQTDRGFEHISKPSDKGGRTCFWSADFTIGKEVIPVSVALSIKREKRITFKYESKYENTTIRKDIEYYSNGQQITPDPDDLIHGYMIGSEPVPYDKTLGITNEVLPRGLKFLAFTKRSKLCLGQFSGNGSYVALAKKDDIKSQNFFYILIKSMRNLNLAMIARRVYNKGNKPKLVVLIPNEDASIQTMAMFELAFGDNFKNWMFPTFDSKKTEPTDQQLEAISNLIDAMDLNDNFGLKIPNPVDEAICRAMGHKTVNPKYQATCMDPILNEIFEPPKKILEQSADHLQKIKEIFVLKEIKKDIKKELVRNLVNIPDQSDGPFITDSVANDVAKVNEVNEVGTVTPAEDFKYLVDKFEDEKYLEYAEQMGNIINDLIFKSLSPQVEKITKAIETYRTEGLFYSADNYNCWIRSLKSSIIERKMFEFWQNVIVKPRFGILSLEESDLVNDITPEEAELFYKIDEAIAAGGNLMVEDETADDLFDMM